MTNKSILQNTKTTALRHTSIQCTITIIGNQGRCLL